MNGSLDLAVFGNGPNEGVVDRLVPRPTPPFSHLESNVSVDSVGSLGPGFADVTVLDSTGRTNRVVLGPSSIGRPELFAQMCFLTACTGYQDYANPTAPVSLQLGEAQPVSIDAKAGLLEISLAGEVIGQAHIDGPLTALTIEISASGDEVWNATIDDVRVSA